MAKRQVVVVSCNDFPDSVHWSQTEADAYVAQMPKKSNNGHILHWHTRTLMVQGEDLRELDFKICDMENSNLRKHLLWSAQHIDAGYRTELRDRLKGPVENGGVTDTMTDDLIERWQHAKKVVEKLTDQAQKVADTEGAPMGVARLDAYASEVRSAMRELEGLMPVSLKAVVEGEGK